MEDQKKSSTEEIDLSAFFTKFGNGLAHLADWLLHCLALARNIPFKNKKTFGLLLLASLGAVFFYHTTSKKFYESKVVVSNSNFTTKLLQDIFENINELAAQKDTTSLSQLLNIPDSVSKTLKKIEATPLVTEDDIIEQELLKEHLNSMGAKDDEKIIVNDIINRLKLTTGNTVEILICSYDPASLKTIEKSLLDFLVNSEYIKKRYDIYKQNLLAKKERLFQESSKLDSLKKAVYDNYSAMAKERKLGSNNVILADKSVSYPLDLYNQDLAFYDQILEINSQLAIRTDFEVISYFTPSNEPANYGLIILIPLAIAVSFLLGYIIVAILAFNAYLSKFE